MVEKSDISKTKCDSIFWDNIDGIQKVLLEIKQNNCFCPQEMGHKMVIVL